MRAILLSLVLLCATSCTASRSSAAETWLRYEPSIVELKGALTRVEEFGPPNFGENPKTDKKIAVPVLVLQHPVNIRGDDASELNRESFEGIRKIQLVFVNAEADYGRFIGHSVVVTGKLFRAESGHHFTDVLLTVKSIRE